MYRIGILGTRSTHAELFSELFNTAVGDKSEYFLDEYSVTGAYEFDGDTARGIASRYGID